MTRQLPTTIITTSYAYTARLHRSVTVGTLADYLSTLENNIDARTFELARALPLDMRVQAINMQTGDRLLIANDPLKSSELPLPPRAGSQYLQVRANGLNLSFAGKQAVTVGWSDKPSENHPDIDLRRFVPADVLPYIPQNGLLFEFRDKQWVAHRTGDARVMLDDIDLMNLPLGINPTQTVRIFARNQPYPVLEFQLSVEIVADGAEVSPMTQGNILVRTQPGIESTTRFLRASERLTLRQIVAALARHDGLSLGNASVYLAHALPLETPLHQIADADAFLHVPLETRQARRVLKLRDQYHTGNVYSIRSGRNDTRLAMGWRGASNQANELDIDLYPSLVAHSPDTRTQDDIKAYLNYTAFAETWSMSVAQDSPIAIFINNRQVGQLPMRLSVDDIITFGATPEHPMLRLKADITIE